jgi:hypothetical protein
MALPEIEFKVPGSMFKVKKLGLIGHLELLNLEL